MTSCRSYTHAHTGLVALSTFPSLPSGAWYHAVIPPVWFSPGNPIMTHTLWEDQLVVLASCLTI